MTQRSRRREGHCREISSFIGGRRSTFAAATHAVSCCPTKDGIINAASTVNLGSRTTPTGAISNGRISRSLAASGGTAGNSGGGQTVGENGGGQAAPIEASATAMADPITARRVSESEILVPHAAPRRYGITAAAVRDRKEAVGISAVTAFIGVIMAAIGVRKSRLLALSTSALSIKAKTRSV